MPFIPRRGRPGLIGLVAPTAVVAGTATAVSGGLSAHRQKRERSVYEAAQYEAAQEQATLAMAAPAHTPAPAPAQADPPALDLAAELQKLGELKAQGVLSEGEFAAAKARLLQ
jgi:hypothetical protein